MAFILVLDEQAEFTEDQARLLNEWSTSNSKLNSKFVDFNSDFERYLVEYDDCSS